MTEENYHYLIYRELKGEISSKEQQELDQWLAASKKHQVERQEIVDALDAFDAVTPDFSVDLDTDYASIKARMDSPAARPTAKVRPLISRRSWLSVAAAVLLLVFFGWWSQSSKTTEWLELATGPSQQKTITLADGSIITLNENTKLNYPASFDGKNRPVKLEGEAFFDVAKKTEQPFIITTSNAQVEVLGTSFNVSSRSGAPTDAVMVLSGRVAFSSLSSKDKLILSKDQSATLDNTSGKIKLDSIPDPIATSWKTARLNFVNTPLPVVFSTLEQHFDVVIENRNPDLKNCFYSFSPSNRDIDMIFQTLKRVYFIDVVHDGSGHYIVSGGEC